MKDLLTQEGREAQVKAIDDSFLSSLRQNSFDICPAAICEVGGNEIKLGIVATDHYIEKGFKMAFASEITLYRSRGDIQENKITLGGSGSFSPKQQGLYWRTIHAASILKNWDLACEIVNTHCKRYADLEDEIFRVNGV